MNTAMSSSNNISRAWNRAWVSPVTLLTPRERTELERLERGHTTAQHIAKRARLILLANAAGLSNQDIATRLGTTQGQVTPWTQRWIARALDSIRERLPDRPRPGAPDPIMAEQGCRVLALAGESPPDDGHPISHWSLLASARADLEPTDRRHL